MKKVKCKMDKIFQDIDDKNITNNAFNQAYNIIDLRIVELLYDKIKRVI